MSPRKAVEKELSREQILDAARGLFVSKGYQNVSMREIGRALGYSHGAIYYHFRDKADLFSALVARDFHLLDETLEEIVKEPYETGDILMGFIEFGLKYPHHFEVMFRMNHQELEGRGLPQPMASYEKFAYYVAASNGKTVDPRTLWSLFLSLYGFVVHYLHTGQTFEELKDLAKTHVSLLIRGIS